LARRVVGVDEAFCWVYESKDRDEDDDSGGDHG
jgi:hypothetical protein